MKNKLNISEKDAKLLLLLFSIIIVAASYFMVFNVNMNKANDISTSNQTLRTRLTQLENMKAQEDAKKEEIQKKKKQITELEGEFPQFVHREDFIVMLDDLEKTAGIEINSEEFKMYELFYPGSSDGTTPSSASASANGGTNNASTDNTTSTTQSSGSSGSATTSSTGSTDSAGSSNTTNGSNNTATTNTSKNGVQTVNSTIIAYKSTIKINFKTTYAGLKKTIDFINNYPNRMSIEELSTAFDSSTGNLTGSMTIYAYSLKESKNKYEQPQLNDINIGVDNIFRTTEIQKFKDSEYYKNRKAQNSN